MGLYVGQAAEGVKRTILAEMEIRGERSQIINGKCYEDWFIRERVANHPARRAEYVSN
jgi:hypothetical protein